MAYDVAVVGASSAALAREPDRRTARRVADEARKVSEAAGLNRRNAALLRKAARNSAERSIRLRWRARQLCYDRFGPIVAVWTEGEPPQQRSDPVTSAALTKLREEPLEPVIGQLFSITVEISSALTLNGDPELARRLQQILDRTDRVMTDLRKVASRPRFDGETEKLVRRHGWARCRSEDPARDEMPPLELASTLLAEAIQTIDRLAKFARENSQAAAMELEEASHAAHRALVVLAPQHG